MKLVAFIELAIMARVAIGALLWQNSFLTPIIFAHFLRMRYFQSPFTKAALGRVIYYIDDFANKPDSPPMIKQVCCPFNSYDCDETFSCHFFRSGVLCSSSLAAGPARRCRLARPLPPPQPPAKQSQ